MRRIINHFTDDDLYKFTMCCAVVQNYPRAKVRYRFTDRNNMVYPQGFARQLSLQIGMLSQLVITDEEIEFMKRSCPYIPNWFYSYLKGFRYNPDCVKVSQDESGHLSMEIEGYWSETILFEVKLLAIVSELYY
ncbi:MAG: nicotinate phosphoribosyltransferase, partial [Muribaculaceae bacterium]|nr:nicotinate phosphoribosyltransferase [Muribaculaceae bacterium]